MRLLQLLDIQRSIIVRQRQLGDRDRGKRSQQSVTLFHHLG